MELNKILNNLWQQYVEESPASLKIYDLLTAAGENVVNDHIAFRTFDDPRIDVNHLGSFFKKSVAIFSYEFIEEVSEPLRQN